MNLDMMELDWALIALSALAAVAYGLFFLDKPTSLFRATVKTLFMAPLLVLFSIHQPPLGPAPMLILVAILGSALGDALLAFDKPAILPLGILAFLIAQLCYLATFRLVASAHPIAAPTLPRYAAMALIVIITIMFIIWLWPKLGALAFGVLPYSLAITAMACAAMLLPWIGWPAMVGAALFVISDSTLSAELFQLPPDAAARQITGPVVWWTYVAAQALILFGLTRLPL